MNMATTLEYCDFTGPVGEVLLLGRLHGAFATPYRVAERLSASRVRLVALRSVSYAHGDGTFGSRYEDA